MKNFIILLLVSGCCYAGVFDWMNPNSAKVNRIRGLIEDFEPAIQKALNDYQVPGISVGVVVDGQLVYTKGFGYRDLENKQPATADTLYAIGSCSKAFTSFLVGTFVDEGRIHWDERMIDILPEFRLSDHHATLHVTLRDLLAHRSGIPQHDLMWYNSPTITRAEVIRRLRYLEPSCDIRERYQYNNLMYLAAGYAMEHLAGCSWETLVSERILQPLGMKQTGFKVDQMQSAANFALPYIEKNDALYKMCFKDISLVAPAGGIHSNVTDLAKWLGMHMNGGVFNGTSVISPAALQEMHAPQSIVAGAPESNESLIYTTGLGWNVLSYRGHLYVSHDGGVDGFTSVVGFLPRDHVGVIVLANKNLTTLPRYLSNQLIDRMLELPGIDWLKEGVDAIEKSKNTKFNVQLNEEMVQKQGTHPTHPLSEYVGEYRDEGYGSLFIEEREGKLYAVINNLECLLAHWHYDVFVIAEESQDMCRTREGVKFSFLNGPNGEVEKVAIPFEPKTKDIVFKKQVVESLYAETYLKQFVGVYEIYGYVVEIVLRKGTLCALIPGQPIYELVPSIKNEFTVKSFANYTIRFVINQNQNVEEVLLIQPYGAFSAKPKK